MHHIDDDDDENVDHSCLEVLEDREMLMTMRMMLVVFVEIENEVELNLMDAYFRPYH